MAPDVRAPVRVLIFSASLRTGSLNTKLANLATKCLEHKGAQADLASMSDFDSPSYSADVQDELGDIGPSPLEWRTP